MSDRSGDRRGAIPQDDLRCRCGTSRAPGPGRRFCDERVSEICRRSAGLIDRVGEAVSRAGNVVRLEHGLHARLVAEVVCHLGAHAGDAQRIADLAERYLQLLEHADEPVGPAEMVGQGARRVGDLLRVGAFLDPVVPGEHGAKVVAKPVLGVLADQSKADVGKQRCGRDKSHRCRQEERSYKDRVRHMTWRV